MEKLVEKCIEREEEMREQNKKLNSQLQVSELRYLEQEKIFQEEVRVVRVLVEEIKRNLPMT
jgi:hypothetical protein